MLERSGRGNGMMISEDDEYDGLDLGNSGEETKDGTSTVDTMPSVLSPDSVDFTVQASSALPMLVSPRIFNKALDSLMGGSSNDRRIAEPSSQFAVAQMPESNTPMHMEQEHPPATINPSDLAISPSSPRSRRPRSGRKAGLEM